MPEVVVNYIAVVAAAIANMVLGAIWYAPQVFGKTWMKAAGKTQKDLEDSKKDMPKYYAVSAVGSLVMSYILAVIIGWAQVQTVALAVILGFLVWLGFVLTVSLQPLLWEGKDQKLFLINNGYNFAALVIMAAILAVWH